MAERFPNREWDLANKEGTIGTWQRVSIAVLMDIREELRALNRRIQCHDFIAIPSTLRRIQANTAKKRRKAKA